MKSKKKNIYTLIDRPGMMVFKTVSSTDGVNAAPWISVTEGVSETQQIGQVKFRIP